jgi:hypothetical protein
MLSQRCFSIEWIREKRQELSAQDPGILEKSIHALALLSHLSDSGLDFIFKGGTSLLLHLQRIRRLSIDVDIICGAAKTDLDLVLQSIGKKSPFIGYEEDDRGTRGLPNRRHFKFSYKEIDGGNRSPHILLDVVEERECHLPLTVKPIMTPFIEVEKETLVRIPTVEGLLGDKLTAYAPNTIGVPFENRNGESQSMQVAKQLFDVGELFSNAENMVAAIEAYHANFQKENEYRGHNHAIDAVLSDTITTSYNYCGLLLKKFPKHEDAIKLRDGTGRLLAHLVGNTLHLNEQMKIAAAKAAFLSMAIKKGKTDITFATHRYSEEKLEEIKTTELTGDFAGLTRLKNINPEAYYYWLMAERLGTV